MRSGRSDLRCQDHLEQLAVVVAFQLHGPEDGADRKADDTMKVARMQARVLFVIAPSPQRKSRRDLCRRPRAYAVLLDSTQPRSHSPHSLLKKSISASSFAVNSAPWKPGIASARRRDAHVGVLLGETNHHRRQASLPVLSQADDVSGHSIHLRK